MLDQKVINPSLSSILITPLILFCVASSMRREKSLHRSDSFQTRQQFARESNTSGPYSSYAAALTGHQPQIPMQQQGQYFPQQQGYMGYYPPQYTYPYPPPMSSTSRDPSRPQSQASSPATTRIDSPGFQPNPFAREFVPTGVSGGGSSVSRATATTAIKESSTPPSSALLASSSRNSTPPLTQKVKKIPSFENNTSSRPLTPTPVFTRSQSASAMRPQPQQQPLLQQQSYPAYPAYMNPPPSMLPCPPPTLLTARQTEWGPPITTGTVRYIANGQPSNPPPLLSYYC